MPKREFVQLAHTFKEEKHGVAGWYLSEKLDGQRCFWDGGCSRGLQKSVVPWANITKDARYVVPPRATGLWSRYGNVIHAPEWWLNDLPNMMLDGELYIKGVKRQDIASIIKKLVPNDKDWEDVRYYCFDSPSTTIFRDGVINNPNMYKVIEWEACRQLVEKFTFKWMNAHVAYRTVYFVLQRELAEREYCLVHKQTELPYSTDAANEYINGMLEKISAEGGEGLIVRNPGAYYYPMRSHQILKIKKIEDAEAIVIGAVAGRETDKGSKLLGKMGALIIDYNGKRLELSGFTDAERELPEHGKIYARFHPGEELHKDMIPFDFLPGTKVTFRYRGLSKEGIPQEARYWRKYEAI